MAVTVWVFVVLGFLAAAPGQKPALLGQGRQKLLAKFVYPTSAACEAARDGVREFAPTAGESLLIGRCAEESREESDRARRGQAMTQTNQ
jgi:hypothetical protein